MQIFQIFGSLGLQWIMLLNSEWEKEFVGSGSFGQVFVSIDERNQQVVAVKSPRLGYNLDREWNIVSLLDHPHIGEVYSYRALQGGNKCIVQKYYSGGELFQLVSTEGRLCPARARMYLKQIASAVQYCHNIRGIVHGDIKPENILLDENQTSVFLVDFGLSFTVCELETHKPVQNLVSMYQAPEGRPSKSWDVWAMGVVLYIMLVGRAPFTKPSMECRFYQRLVMEKDCWPICLDDQVKDLLQRMLEPCPDKRLDIDRVVNHPWMNQDDSWIPERRQVNRTEFTESIQWKL